MWISDSSMPIMGQHKCRSSYGSKFSKADIRMQIKLLNVKYASSWIKHPKSAQSKVTTTMEELTASSYRRATGHCQQPLGFLIEAKCLFSARTMIIKEACANVGISLLNVMVLLHLKTKYEYWLQIQGQHHLKDTQCCDLLVWIPSDTQIVHIDKDVLWSTNI
ncbi:uncharacterized protein LOC125677490 isoform X1 [Ostrea edulis]|uniref:uncharacterized protein LOC125677490 isoform X1 n=1 Tax=Ostrea edulis TaxID=37623 RepID=UPI002094FA4B|nr:uncharacterized protein LOC125677490 isoform X1 [Ostrea edulis]